jgi:hypothetical protein
MTAETKDLANVRRTYQGGRIRAAMRLFGYGYGMVVLAVFAGIASTGPWWLIALVAAGAAGWIAWAEVRLVRQLGLTLGPDGVTVTEAGRRQRFALDEVRGFSQRPWRTGDLAVFVDLVDGRAIVAPGTAVGRRGLFKGDSIRWDGGESSDVVGTLERHLAALRDD